MASPTERVVVIGAGMGGLAAAIDLARAGLAVTVCERAGRPGGKMREIDVGGAAIAAGPTVFTMRWVFDELFEAAGTTVDRHLDLVAADVLARHAWRAGGTLDLFADIDRSADAIGVLAGAREAEGFRRFCARTRDIYTTLKDSFIAAPRPSPLGLVSRVGLRNLPAMWRTAPFRTMWGALGDHFRDPRLRQLFGRYATYVGSSPWRAPATLMLIAHVEQEGVWLVKGGICRVADALVAVGQEQGAEYRFAAEVREIQVERGRVRGVVLNSGEHLDADAVVFNGDVSALGRGLLGDGARAAAQATPPGARSLSAMTWCFKAHAHGFKLAHHNVFFAEDYAGEFRAIFKERRIVDAPTLYLCAQDRGEAALGGPPDAERILMLVNAPADGDRRLFDRERAEVEQRAMALLRACGLELRPVPGASEVTTPYLFERLFPASGGALYGRASHGAMASFERPGAPTRIAGLYCAGGSVHPGPGVPMAAMSGRLAADQLLRDRAASRGSRRFVRSSAAALTGNGRLR